MQSKADCIEPNKKSINSYKSYTGVNYYNTYKRKAKSNIDFIKPNAEYFLDLAIEKEPENAEWIYEKAKFAELSLYNYEKAIILKKANQIAPSNLKIKKAYDNAFKRVQFFEKAKIMAIKNHIEKRTDYNWNSHSNLMRYSYNNKQVFLDSIGNVVLDLGDKYYFSNNRFYNNNDEFNNGLLKVRTQVNQKSNNNRNGTSIVQSSYYSSKNSRYGFLDTNGKMKIENKYHDASSFSEGLAAVKDPITNNWGYIDNKGNIKIPFTYNKAQKFSEGLAFIKKTIRDEKYILGGNLLRKGKYKAAYINKNNEVIISEKFDTGTPFKNGLAKVTKYATNDSFMGGGSDKTYYIDNTGKRINKKNYDRVKPYNNKGFAVVGNEKLARGMRWFIVNRNGEKQHKGTFENEPKFINGIAKVNIGGLINRKYVNIDDTGKIIIEEEKDNIEDSKKIIKELSKTQSVSELETLLKSNFDIVNKSGNGYRIKKGENYGFINNKGDIIIPVEYKRLGFFHNGLAVYTKKSKGAFMKCGYISEIGNVVVKEKYGECGDFSESTAVVAKVSLLGRKVGYININGKTIIPFKFYTGTSFKNGRAQVNDGNFNKPNVYFINTKGQKIN
ncbi:WG repeat-containing protein [Polaribacter ponticola]|uniref:WG repeat-containing protein n=1 Tax=Polaribacter ponticola TaxID=2978475 RepID=A0ABT5S7J9_9FLAO|nr:WG repeat-containing protein [Polaribacter sp. MSW5]MDD7914077.1 WG repeat-containing protein [Polaribacter sp. MSW5]